MTRDEELDLQGGDTEMPRCANCGDSYEECVCDSYKPMDASEIIERENCETI